MSVVDFLTTREVPFDVIEHQPTYDAQRMAEAVHTPGQEVAKTVLVRADSGFAYVVVVVPADRQVDLDKVRVALGGGHVELASEKEVAERCPDCECGALPPFGSLYGLKTIVDQSLAADDQIVFEGNTHSQAIRMAFADFRDAEQPLICHLVRQPVGS